jgi:hypothetical protein
MDDDFGIREGEVAVALPEAFDAHLYFIGRVRTPWTRREQCPKNARESDAVCTLDVDPRFAAALTGVETCTHLLVLYWMDKSRPRPRAAEAKALWRNTRHVRAALSGAAEPDRRERGAPRQGRRHQALRGRDRLPRRHPAPRHQAVFRFDGFGPGR